MYRAGFEPALFLCREIFRGYALSCFKDHIILFNGIFNYSEKAVMNNDSLCPVFAFALNRVFTQGEGEFGIISEKFCLINTLYF